MIHGSVSWLKSPTLILIQREVIIFGSRLSSRTGLLFINIVWHCVGYWSCPCFHDILMSLVSFGTGGKTTRPSRISSIGHLPLVLNWGRGSSPSYKDRLLVPRNSLQSIYPDRCVKSKLKVPWVVLDSWLKHWRTASREIVPLKSLSILLSLKPKT